MFWNPTDYTHLTDALHAWCAAHLLRDLAAFHRADPDKQVWATAMADLLLDAHHHAQAARAAGQDGIDPDLLTDLRRRYLGAYTAGIRDNQTQGSLARDAAALARRFRDHQDMILRFVVDLAVPFTNNQAERDVRPTKTQMKISGCHRAEATAKAWIRVRGYISTVRKHGDNVLDALRDAITGNPWKPPLAC